MEKRELSIEVIPEFNSYDGSKQPLRFLVNLEAQSEERNPNKSFSIDVVFVLDRSGSMKDMERPMKELLKKIMAYLGPNSNVGIVSFGDTGKIEVKLMASTEDNVEKASKLVDNIVIGELTNLSEGMFMGLDQLLTRKIQNPIGCMVVLTDGNANRGVTNPKEIVKTILNNLEGHEGVVGFDVVSIGHNLDERKLQLITDPLYGGYYHMPTKNDMETVLGSLVGTCVGRGEGYYNVQLDLYSSHEDGVKIKNILTSYPAQQIKPNEWTKGKAIVATASPFPDVEYNGKRYVIGQGNNVFIFPGVGLGAIVSEVREITQDMFLLAAKTLAEFVGSERLEVGALYPDQSELRSVSQAIAAGVVKYASREKLGRRLTDEAADKLVAAAMWYPDYIPVEAVE